MNQFRERGTNGVTIRLFFAVAALHFCIFFLQPAVYCILVVKYNCCWVCSLLLFVQLCKDFHLVSYRSVQNWRKWGTILCCGWFCGWIITLLARKFFPNNLFVLSKLFAVLKNLKCFYKIRLINKRYIIIHCNIFPYFDWRYAFYCLHYTINSLNFVCYSVFPFGSHLFYLHDWLNISRSQEQAGDLFLIDFRILLHSFTANQFKVTARRLVIDGCRLDRLVKYQTTKREFVWTNGTHVRANCIEMSSNSSPTDAMSSVFHSPFGICRPVNGMNKRRLLTWSQPMWRIAQYCSTDFWMWRLWSVLSAFRAI